MLALFSGLILFSHFLTAETPEARDLRELSLEELMNTEVISSTQQFIRLKDAPSTMYVVTGDQIRRWGIRRLSELVERLVPGAMSAEDFDDLILAFRGITSDNNLKVLLQLNGHEYNTQWNNGPSSESELGLMDDISRVEVLVGPYSALYGSGALIAVINIITRNGRDFSGIRASGNFGTGDYIRGEFTAGSRVSEDLDYYFSMGGLTAEGYDNNNNSPLNLSRYEPSWRFYGSMDYKDFELMTRFTRSSRALYNQFASTVSPNRWTNYDTFFIDARQNFQINQDLNFILNFNLDTIQTQRHDYTLGTKLRSVGEDRYGVKFTSFYSGWKKNSLLFGANYRRDEFGDDWEGNNANFSTLIIDGVVVGIPADPYSRRTITPYGRNVYAVFGQDTIRFNDTYSLLLGFRFDRIEAPQITDPNTFSPRVALVVTPNEKTVLKAMVTSGISRQPNAVLTSPDSFGFGIPQITEITEPEKMYSFELGASYEPRADLDLALNVFYNSLRNIFGPESKTAFPPVILSEGRIDYVGFEAIATMNITPKALVRVTQQHVQFGAVVDDVLQMLTTPGGEHFMAYPPDVTKLLADVQLSEHFSVNANSDLIWNNFGYFVGQPPRPPRAIESGFYALVNANFVWEPNRRMQLVFSAYNLLNEQKEIPAYDWVSQIPERNFNVNLSFRY